MVLSAPTIEEPCPAGGFSGHAARLFRVKKIHIKFQNLFLPASE
jgi:hypothetical protein